MVHTRFLSLFLICSALLSGCGGGGGSGNEGAVKSVPASSAAYIVVAWNDLGMHCLSPSYDTCVILPPYNTVWAQVIKRGNPPQVMTTGLKVEYRIINNTNSQKGLFAQFWANALKLFGVAPATNFGLNLVNSTISNGLSGTMVANVDHFQVNGIPVVPVEDNGVKNPYQVAEITVKDASGAVIAQTHATVPTSDEINCGKCHAVGGTITQVFDDILTKHDAKFKTLYPTPLMSQKPVLCASCHGSPALGTTGAGSSGKYLSQAIHGFHATLPAAQQPACYDCHPGATTKCNRSSKHTNNNAADGNCTTCHGSLANVAASITSGSRIPWESEPKCSATSCHSGTIPQVDTGTTLYRNAATGHGGVYCTGCHGSPHAMFPSNQASDNYQAFQYQSKAMVLGDCRNTDCHGSSLGGGGAAEFASKHGGSNQSTCNVCHTGFTNAADTTKWPHQFQWKSR